MRGCLRFPGVQAEALKRLAACRALLRIVDAHELGQRGGDDASRSAKGMVFVQNYAVYEYVVVETVRALVADVNARFLSHHTTRSELLALALDAEFASVIDGAAKRTWQARATLLRRVRCQEDVQIREGIFPKDGTHFRPAQLETIWTLFGIPDPVVPLSKLRGHIEEMVDARNRIAHGSDAPDQVGSRFTTAELFQRVDDTEAVCTHLIASATAYSADPSAYQ